MGIELVKKSGSINLTQKQSTSAVNADWLQNDETAKDYIKNRPFYTTDAVKTVTFQEETITAEANTFFQCSGYILLEIGKTYFVNLNGKEYECVAWYDNNYGGKSIICLGNSKLLNPFSGPIGEHGNNEPFVIECYANMFLGFTANESGNYTLSISEMVATDIQIDAKYIPVDNSKMDVNNPVATGSFSMNRQKGSKVGNRSFVSGSEGVASGFASHALGNLTIANADYSLAQGMANIEDTEKKYVHIVGNGTKKAGVTTRSNAHTLDWDGNAWFAGDVYTGSTSGTNKDEGSKKLATEDYVNEAISAIELPEGGSSENEVWEDICDITTEEEASVIYQNFGAKYKKIKVTFEYDFGENVATGIFVHENTDKEPGNTGQSASWMVSYANLKQGVVLFTSFAKENRFLGTGEKHYVNVGINTTSKSSFGIAGAIYQPICRLAQMPNTILNSDEYIEKGIFSLRIAFTNATAIFPAGTRLYVKGVRA